MVGIRPSGSRVERAAAPRRQRRLTADEIVAARAKIVAGLNKRGVTLADAGAILGISETKACRLKSAAGRVDPTILEVLFGAASRGA